MGLLEVLTVIFVVLKLTHLIAWSWLWILSPIWLPVGAIVILFLGIMFGIFSVASFKVLLSKIRRLL